MQEKGGTIQISDWHGSKVFKRQCLSALKTLNIMEKCDFKKIENKGYGVVTRQDIEPGQVILCEEAAIVGPASPESCLECLRITQDFCASCGFSLCCNCKQHQSLGQLTRHDKEECQALQKVKLPNGNFKDLPGLFNIVFPIRFIQLKWSDPGLFKKLICLEGHVEDRKEQVHSSLGKIIGQFLTPIIE